MKKFFPPDFSEFTIILNSLAETFQIAIVSTFLLLFYHYLFRSRQLEIYPRLACAGHKNAPKFNPHFTKPNLGFHIRYFFGPTPIAGVFALTFYSLGYLGKFFSESFESMDIKVALGLKLIGAKIQSICLWTMAKCKSSSLESIIMDA